MKNLKNKWITILIAPVLFIFGIAYLTNESKTALWLFIVAGIFGLYNAFLRINLRDLEIKKSKR